MTEARTHGDQHGTEFVYVVEARSTFTYPESVNGVILDQRWRVIPVQDAPIGVKNRVWSFAAKQAHFLSHDAALALAYWFMANAGSLTNACIEMRLVKIKLTYNWTTEEVGVSEAVSLSRVTRDMAFVPREDPSTHD